MMFTKQQKNQYLAIAVALAIGGSLWGGAACTEAADDYTIDTGNPTPDAAHSVPDAGDGPGVAAGFTNSAAPLTGKKLTVDGVTYAGIAYGGYNKGGGGVTENHLTIQNGGRISKHSGDGGDAYGGRADLGGDARGNTVTIDGGTVDHSVYGGLLSAGNVNGSAVGNHVTIKGASTIGRNVNGGFIEVNGSMGTVTGNIVTIENGTVQGRFPEALQTAGAASRTTKCSSKAARCGRKFSAASPWAARPPATS